MAFRLAGNWGYQFICGRSENGYPFPKADRHVPVCLIDLKMRGLEV